MLTLIFTLPAFDNAALALTSHSARAQQKEFNEHMFQFVLFFVYTSAESGVSIRSSVLPTALPGPSDD
jgi:hypothetical protein